MFADYSEPKSYEEAMQYNDSQNWQLAMTDKMKSLAEKNLGTG